MYIYIYLHVYYNYIPVRTYIVHTHETSMDISSTLGSSHCFCNTNLVSWGPVPSPLAVSADGRSERMARAPHFVATVKQQKWELGKFMEPLSNSVVSPSLFDTPQVFPLHFLRWSFSLKNEKWFCHHPPTKLGRPNLTLESWPSLGTGANVTSKSRGINQRHTEISVTFNVSCLENMGKHPLFFLRQTVAGFLGEKKWWKWRATCFPTAYDSW